MNDPAHVFRATVERDPKTGRWRGEVPHVAGVYAEGRDLTEGAPAYSRNCACTSKAR